AGATGIGVEGWAQAAANTAGVIGNSGSGATRNYGVVGTTNTGVIPTSTITNASVIGFSNVAGTVGIAADNTASDATALVAQANGGGASTAGSFNVNSTGTTNTGISSTVGGISSVGNVGENVAVTGASPNNRGVVISSTGSGTANIGADVTVAGTGAVGVRVNAGAVNGITVDASSANTINGEVVNNIGSTGGGVGYNANFNGGFGAQNPWGYNVNMVNANGSYSGYHVQNLGNSGAFGINIESMTAGTGLQIGNAQGGTGINIGMNGANKGMAVTNVTSATGISVDGVTGGAAIDIGQSAPTSAGFGVRSKAAGTGTAVEAIADGTTTSIALQVGAGAVGGQVVADGNALSGQSGFPQNGFNGDYVLSAADHGGAVTSITIYNSLITANSAIIFTAVNNGGTVGMMTISAPAVGSFTISTTAANMQGINSIYYQVVTLAH
ncbi:MAG TPA: hypothetical protein VGM92_11550, partial [Candidatus Kapabacteria bacterium]